MCVAFSPHPSILLWPEARRLITFSKVLKGTISESLEGESGLDGFPTGRVGSWPSTLVKGLTSSIRSQLVGEVLLRGVRVSRLEPTMFCTAKGIWGRHMRCQVQCPWQFHLWMGVDVLEEEAEVKGTMTVSWGSSG